jgi:hypothetical protein
MGTLVLEEARNLIHKCKLGSKLEIFQNWLLEDLSARQPLSYVSGMDFRQLSEAMRSFESAILDISTMVLPLCDRLFSARLKSQAKVNVYQTITSAYTELYNQILNPANKYETPSIIVPYKPDQLRTMLGAV